jgi:hypothetical protein
MNHVGLAMALQLVMMPKLIAKVKGFFKRLEPGLRSRIEKT